MVNEETILSRYIKQGWSLTDAECPICGTPLLKKGEKYFCAICEKEVKIAKTVKEYLDYMEENIKDSTREKIIKSIQRIIEGRDIIDSDTLELLERYFKLLKILRS